MLLDRISKNRYHWIVVFRDVAQSVARVVWDHDVAGSNPVIPIFILSYDSIQNKNEPCVYNCGSFLLFNFQRSLFLFT